MHDLEDFDSSARLPRVDFEAGLIVFIAIFFSCFGLVVQTSAGQFLRESLRLEPDPLYTFRMQLFYLFPALVAGAVAAKINLETLRKYSKIIFVCAIVLLLSIYVPGLGKSVNGSRRWIDLVAMRMQVSDPVKVALVFVMADYLARWQKYFSKPDFKWFSWRRILPIPTREARADALHGFVFPCAIMGAVCGLIALEPDLGTMALCATVGFAMLFLSGGRLRYILPTVAAGLAAFSTVVAFWPNRLARVTSFLNPEAVKDSSGYQLWQALTGFACGGARGQGLGDGIIYRGFLPEAHTDCVFAVVGEELGFIKTFLVPLGFLIFFIAVIWRLRRIPDVFYFNLCLGSVLFVVLQAVVNMGVVTGLLPTKGMSLPFISYGGSNLVVMFVFVGIIYNCMRNGETGLIPKPTEF